MSKAGFILKCFGTLLEYAYKVIMVAVYSCIIGFLTYTVCSKYAPIDVNVYNDVEWLFVNLIKKQEIFGALAGLFYDISGVAGNINSLTEINVMKEICCGLIMTSFILLAKNAYGLIIRLGHIIFDGWHIKFFTCWVNWICTFLITIISVLFSSMVTDTLFYYTKSENYVLLTVLTSMLLLGLCFVAKLISGKRKNIIGFVFGIVLDIFTTILIYFTIIIATEFSFYTHTYSEQLTLCIALIIAVGMLTALFAYHAMNAGKRIFRI